MMVVGGVANQPAGEHEIPGVAQLEGWRQRARAAFLNLEQATSWTDAHRMRVELIDAVGALIGIEAMIASHLRARTHVDQVGRAGRARLRLALLCIASSAPWDRRHVRALSTIRAALWEEMPAAPLRWSAQLAAGDAEEVVAEVSRVVADLWPLDRD